MVLSPCQLLMMIPHINITNLSKFSFDNSRKKERKVSFQALLERLISFITVKTQSLQIYHLIRLSKGKRI